MPSPLMIASSQLAKRKDRIGEVLVAEPWDLVLVDEALPRNGARIYLDRPLSAEPACSRYCSERETR
jgi:hypothetical protein